MKTTWTIEDVRFMLRAIRLASKGYPAPNPPVGCVLVKDGRVVGEGVPTYAGGPHAEIGALMSAEKEAEGATAYVTLEPCNHHGKTGPCSQALLNAGVRRVVYAVDDPNPKASGGGDMLRSHGILVESGLLKDEALVQLTPFLFSVNAGRPWVVVKAAVSLDGRIATTSGESQWITSGPARTFGHQLRARLGAVLIGRATVEADLPKLTARIKGVVNQPLRIVLDPGGNLSGDEAVFSSDGPSLHITRSNCQVTEDGNLDLKALLTTLTLQHEVRGLLVEGGAKTIGHFFKQGLVNEVVLMIAPKVLGQGKLWLDTFLGEHLSEMPVGVLTSVRKLGPDVGLTVRFSGLETD